MRALRRRAQIVSQLVNLIDLLGGKRRRIKSGSSLTGSNGIKAPTLGVRYKRGGKTNTVTVNITEVGDATITSVTGAELAKYKTNRVAQFGLKIVFAF